ncbi:unnamed protein product [Colias eurytheme]|nr:unnamed protein product [Colias eurytheme]
MTGRKIFPISEAVDSMAACPHDWSGLKRISLLNANQKVDCNYTQMRSLHGRVRMATVQRCSGGRGEPRWAHGEGVGTGGAACRVCTMHFCLVGEGNPTVGYAGEGVKPGAGVQGDSANRNVITSTDVSYCLLCTRYTVHGCSTG